MHAIAKTVCESQQVPVYEYVSLNSGVVLFDADNRDLWSAPTLPFAPKHLAEQIWINHTAQTKSVADLPWAFNCQWWFPQFKEWEPKSHIIHLAACPHEERIYRLRRLTKASSSEAT
jgi:hypothetical protein